MSKLRLLPFCLAMATQGYDSEAWVTPNAPAGATNRSRFRRKEEKTPRRSEYAEQKAVE